MAEPLSPEGITLASRLEFKREPLERPHSPDLNCAICLEEFDNKSFTDTCLHQFCYHCLLEWSKIKPECPLCKQRFRTIIHNVRSINEYEEYHVEAQVPVSADPAPTVLINLAFQRPPFPYRNALDFRTRIESGMYRATLSTYDREDSPLVYIRQFGEMMQEPSPGRPFTRSAAAVAASAAAPPPPVVGTSRHRREIYRQNRWVRADTSGRVRESSPAFYRANPAQTHRLVPWLIRELNVLLDVSMDSQVVCSEILNLISAHPIQSREFRERVRVYLGDRADHFVHEFYNFAISAQDMVSYDLTAEYGAGMPERPWRLANSLPESSTSSDSEPDNDSDLELVNVVHLHVDKKSGGSSRCGGGLRLDQTAGPSGLNYPLGMSDTVIEIESTTSAESSEDEVEIIGTIAPVSPETITLESSSEDEAGEEGHSGRSSLPSCSYLKDTKKNIVDVKEDFLSYPLSPSLAPRTLHNSCTLAPSPLSTNAPSPPSSSSVTHSIHSSSLSSPSSSPSSSCSSYYSPSTTSSTSSSEGSDDEGMSKKRVVRRKRRKRSVKREPKKRKCTILKKKVIRYTSEEEDDEENTEEAMGTKHDNREEAVKEEAESEESKDQEEKKKGRRQRKKEQVSCDAEASTSPKRNSSTTTEEEAEDEMVDVEGNGDSEAEKDYRGRLRSVVVPASKCASRWLWTRVVDYSEHSASESHSD